MKNPIKTKRAAVAVLAAVGTIAAATTAWAVFSETTTANAEAQAGDLVALGLVGYPSTDYQGDENFLWPEHPADVLVTVKNNNEIPVSVFDITDVSVTATGATRSGCAAHVTVNSINLEGWPVTVAPTEEKPLRLVDLITLEDTAPNVCQSATFKTTLTIHGKAI
jgi:hypothetical protein